MPKAQFYDGQAAAKATAQKAVRGINAMVTPEDYKEQAVAAANQAWEDAWPGGRPSKYKRGAS